MTVSPIMVPPGGRQQNCGLQGPKTKMLLIWILELVLKEEIPNVHLGRDQELFSEAVRSAFSLYRSACSTVHLLTSQKSKRTLNKINCFYCPLGFQEKIKFSINNSVAVWTSFLEEIELWNWTGHKRQSFQQMRKWIQRGPMVPRWLSLSSSRRVKRNLPVSPPPCHPAICYSPWLASFHQSGFFLFFF